MNTQHPTTRRALTVVELTLALAITLVIGAALAAVLTTISQVTTHDRDARTASLRAHAVQIRLQAYSESALCVLQSNEDGDFVVWLEDEDAAGSVNPTEIRVFRTDEGGNLICERYTPPDTLTPEELDTANAPVPAATDFFTLMDAYRAADQTMQAILADGLSENALAFDTLAPADSSRLRYTFRQSFASGTTSDNLVALALTNHTAPEF